LEKGGGNKTLFFSHCNCTLSEKMYLEYLKDGVWKKFRCDERKSQDYVREFPVRTIKYEIIDPVSKTIFKKKQIKN
jgi:hypothetical protein